MSSVDFKKHTYTSGAAMVAHMTRHDGQDVEYRNKFIQPELSGENYIVAEDPLLEIFGESSSSKDVMHALRQRVREIDEVQPPKRLVKNRVTLMTYTIAAPEGLSEAQEHDFFRIAHEELARFSGGRENLSPGFVHRDEIHEYVGTGGERVTSRAHMHVAGIPYTAEKGVNGKAFETRVRMRELNRVIDTRCRQELGIRFMTGEKGLTGRSVEDLQAASETRAIRQERVRINAELSDKRQEVRDLSDEVGDLERTKGVLTRENARMRDETSEKAKQAAEAEKAAQRAIERVMEATKVYEQTVAALQRMVDDEPVIKRKLGGREYVEVSPEDYKLLQVAAGNYKEAVAVIRDRDDIIDRAKLSVDQILRQAKIEIKSYREAAVKSAEQFKANMEKARRPVLTHSRGNRDFDRER